MKKLLSQGAEAKIYQSKNSVIKERIPKTYRHPSLDQKLRTRRTKAESKILIKSQEAKINVPKILNQNTKTPKHQNTHKFEINLEFIKGDRLSEKLNSYPKQKQISTMKKLGRQISKLHDNNIIHSDLTTSNAILSETPKHQNTKTPQTKVYLIDFGLSFISQKIEDKAVDLHLIKRALEAKHFLMDKLLFKSLLSAYNPKDKEKILERLKAVERRGRYRH